MRKYKYIITTVSHSNKEYDHCEIKFLEYVYGKSSKHRYNTLDSFGRITFQKNRGEDRWYGLTFITEASLYNHDYLTKLGQIAKFLYENNDGNDLQPQDVIALVGGEEYIRHMNDWIPKSLIGQRFYKVMGEGNGEYLSKIISPTDTLAHKELDKRIKGDLKSYGEVALVFSHIVHE